MSSFALQRQVDQPTEWAFRANEVEVEGGVDWDAGIWRRCSVLKLGEARGHRLQVDKKMLNQVFQHGIKKQKNKSVGTLLDHGSGIRALFGDMRNFQLVGDHLIADLVANKKHPDFESQFQNAEDRPGAFGLSIGFSGTPEVLVPDTTAMIGDKQVIIKRGVHAARCDRLRTVDIVVMPAVTDELFFEETVLLADGTKQVRRWENFELSEELSEVERSGTIDSLLGIVA